LTAANTTTNPTEEQDILFNIVRCSGSCNEVINENVTLENRTRLWSDPKTWPNSTLPVADSDVHIEPGWNVVYDLADSPVYRMVRVNGILTFKNDSNTHLRAKHIFIRAGELRIGSE